MIPYIPSVGVNLIALVRTLRGWTESEDVVRIRLLLSSSPPSKYFRLDPEVEFEASVAATLSESNLKRVGLSLSC